MTQPPPQEHRELVAELRSLVVWTAEGQPDQRDYFGSANPDDWLIRLAGMSIALLVKHRPDEHGRCARCRPRRTGWRACLPQRVTRATCLVGKAARFFLHGEQVAVWWHALKLSGQGYEFAEFREWFHDYRNAHHDGPQTDILPRPDGDAET